MTKTTHQQTAHKSHTHNETASPRKLGRNDPCRCGSGKKYKKCCLDHDESHAHGHGHHHCDAC
jgi:uncharacterized protein YecA (UPF0149 family)